MTFFAQINFILDLSKRKKKLRTPGPVYKIATFNNKTAIYFVFKKGTIDERKLILK